MAACMACMQLVARSKLPECSVFISECASAAGVGEGILGKRMQAEYQP